jgi:2-iminobutanoate/2-iminopropanoate deaminase
MSKVITAPNAPAALGPYSHAILAGDTLYSSGQVPLVPETGKLAGESIEEQAVQVLKNLEAVLAAADMSFANVVKTTVFLTDLADFAPMNAIYAEKFPTNPPARSCVQVAKLPAGAKMEMEVIAVR